MEIKEPILHLVVKVDKSHIEEYDAKGVDGQNLVRSHLYNDADNANKEGVVVAAPSWSSIKEGDTVYFHHSIVEWREGGNVSESYCLDREESLYRVPYAPYDYPEPLYSKVYARKDSDGNIHSVGVWYLVKQVREDFQTTKSGIFLVESIEDTIYASGEVKPKKNFGEVVYGNNDLSEQYPVEKGDIIIHKPDAEYPIVVDGETLWRVWDKFVIAMDKELVPQAVGEMILIKKDEEKTTTESGIIVNKDLKTYSSGTVVSISGAAMDKEPSLDVGVKVLFSKSAAQPIEINKEEYHYIELRKVWATIQ